MKCRVYRTNTERTIRIHPDERMTFKNLQTYVKSHDLVGMRVVKPGSTLHQVASCVVDVCDIVGEITSFKINRVSGWINVSFYGSIDESFKRYSLKAVPRVFGVPTDDGKIKIKRVVTFVIYPYLKEKSAMDKIRKTLSKPFSIKTHKKVFIDYLEVCIDRDGVVHYAVPSHTEWCLNQIQKERNITREEVIELYNSTMNEMPLNHWGPEEFLCGTLGCIMVWNNVTRGKCNEKQRETLRRLKSEGLYYGDVE